jgi:hypothetical protein
MLRLLGQTALKIIETEALRPLELGQELAGCLGGMAIGREVFDQGLLLAQQHRSLSDVASRDIKCGLGAAHTPDLA